MKNALGSFISSFVVSYAVSYATTKMVQNAQAAKQPQVNTANKPQASMQDLLKAYRAVKDK